MKFILSINFLSVIFLLNSCAPDIEKVNKVALQAETVSEAGKEVEMLYSSNGFLKARITAPVMLSHQTENPFTEFPEGVKLVFYDETGKETSRMTAAHGFYYTKNEEMLVRDDVVIVNTNGEMLNSEELLWKRQDRKIYSEKFVRIITPEEIIYGTGFEAKEDFSDYVIKNISGIIKVDEEQKK